MTLGDLQFRPGQVRSFHYCILTLVSVTGTGLTSPVRWWYGEGGGL